MVIPRLHNLVEISEICFFKKSQKYFVEVYQSLNLKKILFRVHTGLCLYVVPSSFYGYWGQRMGKVPSCSVLGAVHCCITTILLPVCPLLYFNQILFMLLWVKSPEVMFVARRKRFSAIRTNQVVFLFNILLRGRFVARIRPKKSYFRCKCNIENVLRSLCLTSPRRERKI